MEKNTASLKGVGGGSSTYILIISDVLETECRIQRLAEFVEFLWVLANLNIPSIWVWLDHVVVLFPNTLQIDWVCSVVKKKKAGVFHKTNPPGKLLPHPIRASDSDYP